MLEDHRSGPRHDSLMSPYREDDSGSVWMVSYIDIMTILVALFVIIIAAAGATSPDWMASEATPDPLLSRPHRLKYRCQNRWQTPATDALIRRTGWVANC